MRDRVYVSTACIKKNNIAEIIQLLAQHNMCNIELSGGTDYYREIEHDLKELKQKYHLNYACHAYFPPPKIPFVVNLASCNDDIYEQSINHYVQCVEMLRRLDCKVLSVHAGFFIEIGAKEIGKKINSRIIYDEDDAYDRFCAAYKYIDKLCGENGITLFLENNVLSAENYAEFESHNYFMMTDYASIMKMRERMDFNLLLDLGHLHVSANALGLDYAQQCGWLKEYIKWIHISENNGIFDEHKPLKGESNIVKEFDKVYASPMNVTLETVGSIEEILASAEIIGKL